MFNACPSAALLTEPHWTQGNGMALAFRVWHTPHAAAQQELTKLLRQLEFSLAYWSWQWKFSRSPWPKPSGAAPAEPGEHLHGEKLLWACGTTAAVNKLSLALDWEHSAPYLWCGHNSRRALLSDTDNFPSQKPAGTRISIQEFQSPGVCKHARVNEINSEPFVLTWAQCEEPELQKLLTNSTAMWIGKDCYW